MHRGRERPFAKWRNHCASRRTYDLDWALFTKNDQIEVQSKPDLVEPDLVEKPDLVDFLLMMEFLLHKKPDLVENNPKKRDLVHFFQDFSMKLAVFE